MIIIMPLFFLLLILFDFYIFAFAFSHTGRHKTSCIVFILMFFSFIILYSLTMDIRLLPGSNLLFDIIKIFQNIPMIIYVLILLIILTVSVILLYKENLYEQNAITRTSIKESIDNLPMGLSFSTKSGIVFLSNRFMNNLCHKITGRELQDAEYFWEDIKRKGQNIHDNPESNSQTSIIKINDEETWSFTRHSIKINMTDGVQITAVNITQLDELRSQLKNKNTDFVKMNSRLREYSENLAVIKSKEERLATKAQLHNELGYILLATRKAMLNKNMNKEEGQSVLNLWKQNINVLLSGRGIKEKNAFEELIQSAYDIGIKLHLHGDLPQENNTRNLILTAAIEALNNAVRHGEATELNLIIKEKESGYIIELTNNGIIPEGEIVEGGGLSALRRKVEVQRGTMGIDIGPIFKLWIRISKGKEVYIYDKSIDC